MWEIASTVVAFFVLYWSYYIASRKNKKRSNFFALNYLIFRTRNALSYKKISLHNFFFFLNVAARASVSLICRRLFCTDIFFNSVAFRPPLLKTRVWCYMLPKKYKNKSASKHFANGEGILRIRKEGQQ